MKQHRILIATDVPFWRNSTGAQTRIRSLVEFLTNESFVVRTFYLGQTGSEQFTEADRQLIADQNLDIEQQSSDQIPKSLIEKIGWYANQIRPNFAAEQANQSHPQTDQHSDPPEALRLEDFRWPWAAKAFLQSVKEFQPNSILIQYVKLSYLIDDLSSHQRNSIHCVIDTHDALHLRNQRFKERGFRHWIEISREEEARELDKFDAVIAIQPQEAELFETMAPQAKTILCGHAPKPEPTRSMQRPADGPADESPEKSKPCRIVIGYLASTNDSNIEAINGFLDSVWQPLKQQHRAGAGTESSPKIELVIGGSICNSVSREKLEDSDIQLLGHVENLAEFYNLVDVVINPVEFGTGLKIKSVEGLAYGKPLISTPEGTNGLEQFSQVSSKAIVVCRSADQFVLELKQLANDPSRLAAATDAAAKLAQSAFSQQHAYSPLKRLLLQGK